MNVQNEVRQWMYDAQYNTEPSCYENATQLAEAAADTFEHDEWLDDPEHWIWELAVEFFD